MGTKVGAQGYRPFDGAALNTEYEMSNGWATTVLGGWERQGKVRIVREGRRVVGVRLPSDEAGKGGNGASLRDRLVALMQRESDAKGNVPLTTDAMRRKLGTDPHDLIKVLWDLQKQGQLTFRQVGGSGSSSNLVGYRLRGELIPKQAPVDNALAAWSICPECFWERRYHRTDDEGVLLCPANPKQGSPRFLAATDAGLQAAQDVAPSAKRGDVAAGSTITGPLRGHRPHPIGGVHTVKPGPVTSTWVCREGDPECGQRFTDPVGLKMHKDAKHLNPDPPAQNAQSEPQQAAPAEVAPAPDATLAPSVAVGTAAATEEFEPGPFGPYVDWAQYPLVTAAARRYAARVRAAEALDTAGDIAVAQSIRDTLTEQDKQLSALLVALGYEMGGTE